MLRFNSRLKLLNFGQILLKRSSSSSTYSSTLPENFYNEEQLEMQKTFQKVIDTDINPFVDEWEKNEEAPLHELFKKLGNLGVLGVSRSAEYGGLGLPYKYHAGILETAGSIWAGGISMAFAVQTDITIPALERFGTHELKKEFLEPTIKGDYVACLGVTEPGAGSDVANITTTAVKKGGDYVINGQKTFISNGLQADWICLLCNTSGGKPHKNKSLICVPTKDAKGLTRTKINKIGMHSSDTAQIFLEDVHVPVKNLIGDEGAGFIYQMLQFQWERLAGTLLVLRAMDNCISITIDYTRDRKAFGKSILDNQVVHFRLAELATEIESLRALTYLAIDLAVDGKDVTRLASMSKLKAGRLAREVTDSCLQYWGGMGYTREAQVSRYFRDKRLLSIGAGADEVMLSIISKLMGTMPK